MTKKILAIVLGLAMVFSAGSVFAGFTSDNADYQVTLQSGCTIDAGGANFGNHTLGGPDLIGTWAGNVIITCGAGTNYMWGIDSGANFTGMMNMSNGTDLLSYSLYESGMPIGNFGLETMDPSFTPTNSDPGRGTYVASGFGDFYSLTADVRISTGPTPGVYTDTVVVSVAWP